jgi:hypothetical protein
MQPKERKSRKKDFLIEHNLPDSLTDLFSIKEKGVFHLNIKNLNEEVFIDMLRYYTTKHTTIKLCEPQERIVEPALPVKVKRVRAPRKNKSKQLDSPDDNTNQD